jgi:hypothetical protein
MTFKKGQSGNKDGRKKGAQNESTKAIKAIYVDILQHEQQFWPDILEKLREENPHQYMMVMDKISQKVVANKRDITSDDKPITPDVRITERRDKSK